MLALLHLVIFEAIILIFPISAFWQLIIGIIFLILCLSFVLSSILGFNFNNLFTRVLYKMSVTWLGCAFYLFLVSCLSILLTAILQVLRINISLDNFYIFCFLMAIIASTYGVFHARKTLVKNVKIKLANLPASWKDKKIIFISDIHLGAVNGKNFAKKVVKKINEQDPDIIFIGGDLFDGVKINEDNAVSPFADLHPVLGTYFVTGNHEEFRPNGNFLKAIKKVGIRVLDNEMVLVEGIQLIGVDDRDSTNEEKFKNILTNLNIDKNKLSILLKHQPSQLDIASKANISMQISGHTHKAQVFPLNLITKSIFKGYDYGLHIYDKMNVFTSSGVGTWGPPLRVGSDSEIMVFTFTTSTSLKM